jgi:hypothetical protein
VTETSSTNSQAKKAPPLKKAAFIATDQILEHFDTYFPLICPDGCPRWKEWEFVTNPTEGQFDAMGAFQSVEPLNREYRLQVPPTKTLLTVMEPPEILTFPDGFTNQFHSVLSQSRHIKCRNPMVSHSGHHWFIERAYNQILDCSDIEKTKLLSMVISSKQDTEGHRKRWKLAQALKEHFGDCIDWFGRGVQELKYKRDGVLPYQYHIVLENSSVPHYWTEKIADAFVSNSFPFYWGDPKIAEHFPAEAMVSIDIDHPDRCIAAIESAIDQHFANTHQTAMLAARTRLLQDHHRHETYRKIWNAAPESPPALVTIQPHSEFLFSVRQKLRFYQQKLFTG